MFMLCRLDLEHCPLLSFTSPVINFSPVIDFCRLLSCKSCVSQQRHIDFSKKLEHWTDIRTLALKLCFIFKVKMKCFCHCCV